MNIKNTVPFVSRTETMEQYLKEINRYTVPTPQEEKDLFAKYRAAKEAEKKCLAAINLIQSQRADEKSDGKVLDPETEAARDDAILKYRTQIEDHKATQDSIRNEIISRNLRLNYAIAKRYSTGELLPDLVATGQLGMYEAFEEYDPAKDVRFGTYAQYYIRRAINAYLVKENLLVRPKNGAKIAPKVKKIENDFFLKNGRRPYPVEIIDILRRDYGIDVKDETDVYGTKIEHIEQFIGDEEDNTFEKSGYFNEHTAVENDAEDHAEQEDTIAALQVAMDALNDREKRIISMAYGIGYTREYKDREIGQALGLTSERIRQLRKGAITKMRSAIVSESN